MRRAPKTSRLIDVLHRGAVISCVAVTAAGLIFGGIQIHHYMTVVRPERRKVQEQLIAAGKSDPEELRG